ncbi:MAG: hypothetical protein B6247_22265 [Candidatus Parabeggiatoa sp. nov. 2]|nr:MAG: hypothetical protein B6247_22265 [Beggiatoa sp. 4572_84]
MPSKRLLKRPITDGNNDNLFCIITEASFCSLAVFVSSEMPTPAKTTNNADALPSTNDTITRNVSLPVVESKTILKFTKTMPKMAKALAKSYPIILVFIINF